MMLTNPGLTPDDLHTASEEKTEIQTGAEEGHLGEERSQLSPFPAAASMRAMWRPTVASFHSAECWNGILQDRKAREASEKSLGFGCPTVGSGILRCSEFA